MAIPYRARFNAREFLNYPGFHGGAYVLAYVEDTSERDPVAADWDPRLLLEPDPRVILEISDCSNRIELEFEVTSEAQRANSLHKIDTLIEVLTRFRSALAEEAGLYAERQAAASERASRDEKTSRNGSERGRRGRRRRASRR